MRWKAEMVPPKLVLVEQLRRMRGEQKNVFRVHLAAQQELNSQ